MKTWTKLTLNLKSSLIHLGYVHWQNNMSTLTWWSLQEHLRAWLADPQGRDQYVTYRGEDVEIFWHGKPSQCELAYKPVGVFISHIHYQFSLYHVGLEGFSLRGMVPSRNIRLYFAPPGCTTLGRPLVEASAAIRPSHGEAHRLFTMRELHRHMVERPHRSPGRCTPGTPILLPRWWRQQHRCLGHKIWRPSSHVLNQQRDGSCPEKTDAVARSEMEPRW